VKENIEAIILGLKQDIAWYKIQAGKMNDYCIAAAIADERRRTINILQSLIDDMRYDASAFPPATNEVANTP
jgi:hypothetical protein